jgi:hypothetical protein
MERFNYPVTSVVSSTNHVVDWQLVRPAATPPHGTAHRDVREQIGALQAHAVTLLHGVRTSHDTSTARRALSNLEAEITVLRAELAWRRLEALGNDHSHSAHAADG